MKFLSCCIVDMITVIAAHERQGSSVREWLCRLGDTRARLRCFRGVRKRVSVGNAGVPTAARTRKEVNSVAMRSEMIETVQTVELFRDSQQLCG